MRLRLFLLLALAALPAADATRAAAQDGTRQPDASGAAAWARYTYPGDEFSVELPGMPTLSHMFRGLGGPMNFKSEKMRVFSLYSGGVIFFVAAYDRPQKSESLDSFASHLRGAWGLSPKGEVGLGGFEGKSYVVSGRTSRGVATELYGEGRAFRTKKHAYFVLALSQGEGRAEVTRFLDSLALEAKPSGERVAEPAPVTRYEPPKTPPQGGTAPAVEGDAEATKPTRREGASADGPFPPTELTRRALIVYKPEPGYTEEARRSNARGTIRLRVVLSSTGEVKNISVFNGLPDGLTEKAIDAARRMLFFPAEKDGRPVSQYVVLEYNFNIY
jgi:TonB family protein